MIGIMAINLHIRESKMNQIINMVICLAFKLWQMVKWFYQIIRFDIT